jgi:hypothetical protein
MTAREDLTLFLPLAADRFISSNMIAKAQEKKEYGLSI